jgi:hypothetical protein
MLRSTILEALHKGASQNGIAAKAGVAHSALHRFLYGRPGKSLADNIRLDLAGKLMEAMDLVVVHRDQVKED